MFRGLQGLGLELNQSKNFSCSFSQFSYSEEGACFIDIGGFLPNHVKDYALFCDCFNLNFFVILLKISTANLNKCYN